MYIQITTRCNMHCRHCCMSATSKGEDMSEKVFRAAVEMDEIITLGGGEPTLHPKFWKFMAICLGNKNVDGIWLATNGSQTETALALAKMAKSGVISCALSRDQYHDPIDPEVVRAFDKGLKYGNRDENDLREIRTVTSIMAVGRAKNLPGAENDCPCSETIIKPNGNMYWCGCEGAPKIGNILKGKFDTDWEEHHSEFECFRGMKTSLVEA